MYRLTAKIEITGAKSWLIDKVTEVEITRDTEKLTDECPLTPPKKIKWDGTAEIPVQRGDAVKVWLGYNDDLQLAFMGYVRDVGFKTPVVITCENEMFKLKQMPAQKKAYKNVTIETLLQEQGISYDIKVMGEQNLGQYRVTADTVTCTKTASAVSSDTKRARPYCIAAYCSSARAARRRYSLRA